MEARVPRCFGGVEDAELVYGIAAQIDCHVTDNVSAGFAPRYTLNVVPDRAARAAARYRSRMRAVAIVNGNARRVGGRLRKKLEKVLPGGVRFTRSLGEARVAIREVIDRGTDQEGLITMNSI